MNPIAYFALLGGLFVAFMPLAGALQGTSDDYAYDGYFGAGGIHEIADGNSLASLTGQGIIGESTQNDQEADIGLWYSYLAGALSGLAPPVVSAAFNIYIKAYEINWISVNWSGG